MKSLRETNLYREVLINPFQSGAANHLRIVSGYASPTMLGTHLADIQDSGNDEPFSIELVVGMSGGASLSERAVSAFLGQRITTERFRSRILVPEGKLDIHSKVYVWYRDRQAVKAWAGSANYTRLAFGLNDASDLRDEVLIEVPPSDASRYVEKIFSASEELEDGIKRSSVPNRSEIEMNSGLISFNLPEKLDGERYAICPLINRRSGEVHNAGAGLNWGQPTETRSRKDVLAAYIPVPSNQTQVFPAPAIPFEAVYQDGQVLVLARGQQGGKAISMPSSNEGLGIFFRSILEVEGDRAVTTDDLEKFGSDCVVFEKLNDQQYAIHFYPGLHCAELASRQE